MKKERKRKSKQEKGITLIALVITIIILLILAGVTLNGALSENGLFQRAKEAVKEYKKAEETESQALEEIEDEMEGVNIDYNNYVGAYVTEYNPRTIEEGCTIGTTTSGTDSAQPFTTDGDMKWRIWDYDRSKNTIRLISSKPTNAQLILKNVNGYNNGVWAINEVCRDCYSNGETGVTVANLRRTDIQKVSKYKYQNYKHKQNEAIECTEDAGEETLINFGEAKTYLDGNVNYPMMWKKDRDAWTYEWKASGTTGEDDESVWERENGYSQETGLEVGSDSTQFKQSYYGNNYLKHQEGEFINKIYYDLLFKDPESGNNLKYSYWLASRYVHLGESYCSFGIQTMDVDPPGTGLRGFLYSSSRCTEWC